MGVRAIEYTSGADMVVKEYAEDYQSTTAGWTMSLRTPRVGPAFSGFAGPGTEGITEVPDGFAVILSAVDI